MTNNDNVLALREALEETSVLYHVRHAGHPDNSGVGSDFRSCRFVVCARNTAALAAVRAIEAHPALTPERLAKALEESGAVPEGVPNRESVSKSWADAILAAVRAETLAVAGVVSPRWLDDALQHEGAHLRWDAILSVTTVLNNALAATPPTPALTASGRTLAECAYWYFLMTQQGGPDGSELDAAVTEDMLYALRAWAGTIPDKEYLEALDERFSDE